MGPHEVLGSPERFDHRVLVAGEMRNYRLFGSVLREDGDGTAEQGHHRPLSLGWTDLELPCGDLARKCQNLGESSARHWCSLGHHLLKRSLLLLNAFLG